ncbi:Uncharacterised protein r2_g2979 [Pycnogonum litorale]
MSSFWKFWAGKHKEKENKSQPEEDSPTMERKENSSSPGLERPRSRNQMSVSRSGRYKQRNRQRSGILDNPDFIDKEDGADQQQTDDNRQECGLGSITDTTNTVNGRVSATDGVNKCDTTLKHRNNQHYANNKVEKMILSNHHCSPVQV